MLRALLLLLAFPLAIAAAEVPVAVPTAGASSEFSEAPVVASNGATFAVAWTGETPHVAIYDASGNVIARAPRLTSEFAFAQGIAAFGRDYVFVYGTSNLLHAAIIGEDGTVRANEPLMTGWSGTVAVLGSIALVVNERGSGTEINARAQIIRDHVLISSGNTYSPDVAASRSSFYVVGLDEGQLHGAMLAPDEYAARPQVPIGASDPVAYSGDRPSIASDGDAFVVVWRVGEEIHAADIDSSGTPSAPRTIASNATGVPSIAWSGTDYVVVYPSGADIVVVHLKSGETSVLHGDRNAAHVRIAASAHDALIVREEFGTCFARAGITASYLSSPQAFLITKGVAAQLDAVAASDGRTYAVALVERAGIWHLRVAFAPFDGHAIDIRSGAEIVAPAIATGAGEFLITFAERQEDCTLSLQYVLVQSDGSVSGVQTIARKVSGTRPAIGWNGSEFVVVWEKAGVAELNGARIAPDGTAIDRQAKALTTAVKSPDSFTSVSAISPSLRWTGSEWLLIWQAFQTTDVPFHSDPPPISLMRLRRISRDLQPASAERTLENNAWYPTVDANAPFVVWIDARGLMLAQITAEGSLAGERVIGASRAYKLSIACSTKECDVAADAQLFRLSRDRSTILALQTLAAPVTTLASDGSSLLVITSRETPQRLFAMELPPIGPRRRLVR